MQKYLIQREGMKINKTLDTEKPMDENILYSYDRQMNGGGEDSHLLAAWSKFSSNTHLSKRQVT